VAGLVARYDTAELWPWLLPTAPLAIFGPRLAAIDLDVQRLPDKLLLPMAVIVSMAVIAITILTGDPARAGRAFAGGLASLAGHWILHRASRGGLGYGDVKLAGTLGIATSSINLTTLWWSLMIGVSAAAIWSPATQRRGHFTYGPWLIAGALTATTLLAP